MELLEPFHAQALATAHRLSRSPDDGDDLYQETLRRAFDKLPGLRDPERFRPWFFAVLLSVHRSRSRRSFWKRFLSLEAERSRGFDPPGPDGEREAEIRLGAERAARMLALLPAVQREAIVLFDLEGRSLEETAALQNASLSAVKTRLSRGRERLREHYRKRGWNQERGDAPASPQRRSAAPADPTLSALLGAAPLLAKRESGHE